MAISKTNKGRKTKEEIIAQAKEVFNQKGISITLSELAGELGHGLSYITNHFRTKDHLFVAIAQAYEIQFQAILLRYDAQPGISLLKIAQIFSDIMDQQYAFRCAIIAIFASSSSQKVLYKQVAESYPNNKAGIRELTSTLVETGYLEPKILEEESHEVFNFQFVNLFMTWVVNLELYDQEKTFKQMKPIYLRGILQCFLPYLTPSGKQALEALDIEAICDSF